MANSIKFTWCNRTGETRIKEYVDTILSPVDAADFAKDVMFFAEQNYNAARDRLHEHLKNKDGAGI